MTPEQLKASILQLAIQGKLVPQRPEDGTAEELYQQIQKEKKKLTASGKLKEKPLPPITEDEIPFDIPESWKWVRLGELSKIVTGKRDANFGSIDGEYLFFTCAKDPIRCATYSFDCNAILMAGNGDLSNISRYCGKFEAYQRTYVVEGIGSVNLDYLYYHLLSNWVAYNKEKIYGSVIQYVRLGNLLEYAVALPPLAEQQRIVEKIEQMLPLVEQYGEAYTALESLDARFPDDMRKSILQYAIQGKLVPQRPEEGTAEDLYQQIQKEKKKLSAASKLKKEKPLPPITEDEIPFDIPDSWKWVRLGALSSLITKGTTPRGGNLSYSSSGIAFLRAENVVGITQLDKSNLRYVDQETHSTVLKRSILEEDDILITIAGTLGRTALVRKEDLPLNANQAVSFMRPIIHDMHTLKYILYALNASVIKNILLKQQKVTAIPNLTLENISSCCIPFPPISEQRRIVKKLEQMLPQLGKHQSQQHHDNMHLQEHKYTE